MSATTECGCPQAQEQMDSVASLKSATKSEVIDGKIQTKLVEVVSEIRHRSSSSNLHLNITSPTTPFPNLKTSELDSVKSPPNTDGGDDRIASTSEEGDEDDDTPERETWDKKTEFLLAVIGFAVDLGKFS